MLSKRRYGRFQGQNNRNSRSTREISRETQKSYIIQISHVISKNLKIHIIFFQLKPKFISKTQNQLIKLCERFQI